MGGFAPPQQQVGFPPAFANYFRPEEQMKMQANIDELTQEVSSMQAESMLKDRTILELKDTVSKGLADLETLAGQRNESQEAHNKIQEELDTLKGKHQELRQDCANFWKQIHSVGLPSGCLGMGEDVFGPPRVAASVSESILPNAAGGSVATAVECHQLL